MGEGGKIWENGIETCKISCMKRKKKPQLAPGLVFAVCIELLHFDCKEYNQSDFGTIWWCPCLELNLVLLGESLCYDQCILGKILLAFALLYFVLQGQTCLLLEVPACYSRYLTSYFCITVPYDEKNIFFWC